MKIPNIEQKETGYELVWSRIDRNPLEYSKHSEGKTVKFCENKEKIKILPYESN